jgi:hypothetical protein
MRLSEQAVLDYRERGYLVPPYCLEPDLLQSLQQALDQLIRDNPVCALKNSSVPTSRAKTTKG